MIHLNCKTCCLKGENDVREASLSIQNIFFSPVSAILLRTFVFKVRKMLPSTAFATFRRSRMLVIVQSGPALVLLWSKRPPHLLEGRESRLYWLYSLDHICQPSKNLLYWEISSQFRIKIRVTNLCHISESVNINSENLLYSSTDLIAFMSELLETKLQEQLQTSHSNEMFPVWKHIMDF